jgi:hypothetical protein
MGKRKFAAEILSNDTGGMYVIVPFDVEKEYGKKRVKIIAKIESATYKGSLVRMGSPDHILLIRKDIRIKIGKTAGDFVNIEMEEDTEPRVVTVPSDLQKLLDENPTENVFFQKLSYTHQKEYVQWIEGAKKEDTRLRRLNKAIEMMKEGTKGK